MSKRLGQQRHLLQGLQPAQCQCSRPSANAGAGAWAQSTQGTQGTQSTARAWAALCQGLAVQYAHARDDSRAVGDAEEVEGEPLRPHELLDLEHGDEEEGGGERDEEAAKVPHVVSTPVYDWVDPGHELEVLGLGRLLLDDEEHKARGERRHAEHDGKRDEEPRLVELLLLVDLVRVARQRVVSRRDGRVVCPRAVHDRGRL